MCSPKKKAKLYALTIIRLQRATPCTNSKCYVIQSNVASEAISTNSFEHNLFKSKYRYVKVCQVCPRLRLLFVSGKDGIMFGVEIQNESSYLLVLQHGAIEATLGA